MWVRSAAWAIVMVLQRNTIIVTISNGVDDSHLLANV